MKRTFLFFAIAGFFLAGYFPLTAVSQPTALDGVNTTGNDYGAQLRYLPSKTEIWFTRTSGNNDTSRSRKLVKAEWTTNGLGVVEDAPAPLNQLNTSLGFISLVGAPTFSLCDTNRIIIVSNELVDGVSKGNDLYEGTYIGSQWIVKRLDILCSDYWDDTPSLSADGSTLYFASDRRSPGRGHSDIYVSTKNGESWSSPVMLTGLASDPDKFAVETPFLAADGFLYYSTNETPAHDFDIWKIKIDPSTKLPMGDHTPVDLPGVNMPGSDEGHPFITPGGNWLIFSSNRGPKGNKDLDIYSTRLRQREQDTIAIHVMERTHQLNTILNKLEDTIFSYRTSVDYRSVGGKSEKNTISTDNDGRCQIIIQRNNGTNPYNDLWMRRVIVSAQVPPGKTKLVTSTDTLAYDVNYRCRLKHDLYVWDSAVYYTKDCTMDFRTKDIPFFIQGYWCPTTIKYKWCQTCSSVFEDTTCRELNVERPVLPCKPEDALRVYTLKYTEPTIEVTHHPGLCMNWNEWKTKRYSFAQRVDTIIDLYIEEMKTVFSKETQCIERAIEHHKTISIDITGWTDPKTINPACEFTDENIDMNVSKIKMLSTENKNYIKKGIIKKGTQFISDAHGNQMLSDLRAYYTAVMLDSLWSEYIPRYRSLRETPGGIQVTAIGMAISPRTAEDFELQRSVDVTVSTPTGDREATPAYIPPPGISVALCPLPCGELYEKFPSLSSEY